MIKVSKVVLKQVTAYLYGFVKILNTFVTVTGHLLLTSCFDKSIETTYSSIVKLLQYILLRVHRWQMRGIENA